MRTLSELTNTADPAWPLVQEWVAGARCEVEVLPPSSPANEAELVALQVTTRSPMGAIAYESGGIRVDGGWLALLGSGHVRCPFSIVTLTERLGFWADRACGPSLLVVAVDRLGGIFAVDGGALGAPGKVFYFAPDTLSWENTTHAYSAFASWVLGPGLDDFYDDLRWDGWRDETRALDPDEGISFYPPLWSKESRPLERASRRRVRLDELCAEHLEMARQLSGQR